MTWRTAITDVEPGSIRIRGYDQAGLMEHVPFSDVVFLTLQGELPSDAESRLFSAVLTACIDHSVTPPSAQATRTVRSGGATLPSAVASGLLSISDHHGGAMLELQRLLETIVSEADSEDDVVENAEATVEDYLETGTRIPGVGHRYHDVDPRAKLLFDLAGELGFDGPYRLAFQTILAALEAATGSNLPPNVDGAIAVVLAELDFEYELSQATFVIGRAVGLAAHAHEEFTREEPMRQMGPTLEDVTYDGPAPRDVPDRYDSA